MTMTDMRTHLETIEAFTVVAETESIDGARKDGDAAAQALLDVAAEVERLREQVSYKDDVIEQRNAMLTAEQEERRQEVALLQADNASLVGVLTLAHGDLCEAWGLPRTTDKGLIPKTLAKPHPGADLHAEMKRLHAALEWTQAYLTRVGDTQALATLNGLLAPPKT